MVLLQVHLKLHTAVLAARPHTIHWFYAREASFIRYQHHPSAACVGQHRLEHSEKEITSESVQAPRCAHTW
jgi:hypothetical protein